MTGEYQHSLDSKGRLFIPAKLRDELGEVFFVTLSMERCLCAYSSENWQTFSDKVNAMPYVKQRKMRPLFAHAARFITFRLSSRPAVCCAANCLAVPLVAVVSRLPWKESVIPIV